MQITEEQAATYHRDGVVLLRGMFDQKWVDLLDEGLEERTPGHLVACWVR